MDFLIDTAGDQDLLEKEELIGEEDEDGLNKVDSNKLSSLLSKIKIACKKFNELEENTKQKDKKCTDYKTDEIVDNFFAEMNWNKDPQYKTDKTVGKKKKKVKSSGLDRFTNINLESGKFKINAANVDLTETMKKSVLTPGIEQEFSLPEYSVSKKRQIKLNKIEKEKNKGPLWYNLPAPEITEELKNDLQLLKMRSVMDPKHFYKKNDMEKLPKYFQVGTVMDSPLEHQNERLTRKERKKTFVDEMLSDAEFKRYNKRKYSEIVEEKRKSTYKTYIKDKRMKSKQAYKKKKLEGKIPNKKSKYN